MPAQNAKSLCDFIDASPTPYHAVDSAQATLNAVGAVRLDERDAWRLEPGRTYYVARDGASLVAFRMGRLAPSEAGFAFAGAHTDAPGLRARIEKSVAARGFERAAVEAYGGPIHSTWLDRPLSLAGRVVVRSAGGRTERRLVNFARPVAVIPNLAIHFNRDMNKGVEYAMNGSLLPIVSASGHNGKEGGAGASWLVRAVAAELCVETDAVVAAELTFVDAAPSIAFGMDSELLSAPRIDNLEGCHAVLSAFASATARDHGQVAVLFDNEEIGSGTSRGADSAFLRDIVERIVALSDGSGPEAAHRALARSFSVSVDGAQGWHPSYADKFDEDFAPVLNGGPAVKANANVRYATDAVGEAAFRGLCESSGVPCQRFRMRADLAPGTTIGPISSAMLGVRTVDVGVPMLAMHSCRETAGAYDHDYMISALRALYASGPSIVD
ncbi:MAG: M18 family aminopeptidase [Spirochaetae bacterium HGW-Spirochaetae-3]|jgi:aspartyl aminopeptidase|nr:MAG: M18 family aminopeptidase [Spirochaetae bacterium HGW-Spirochaetae-3]